MAAFLLPALSKAKAGNCDHHSTREALRREGLAYAMIETMAQNETGQHLYPACGFIEVARQVHFARKL